MKFIKKALIVLLVFLLAMALFATAYVALMAYWWHDNATADRAYDYPSAKWICEENGAWIVLRTEEPGYTCTGQMLLDGETFDITFRFMNGLVIEVLQLKENKYHEMKEVLPALFRARERCTPEYMILSEFQSGTINVDDFPASMKFVRVELTDEERELYNIASEPDPEADTGFDAQASSPFSTQSDEDPNQAA